MNALLVDIGLMADALEPAIGALVEAYEIEGAPSRHPPSPNSPPVLAISLSQLFEVLREIEQGFAHLGQSTGEDLSRHDLGTLGNYGVQWLDEAAGWANFLENPALGQDFSALILPLACWTARRGGELTALKPIVDHLVRLMDQTVSLADSERLLSMMDNLFHAVGPGIAEDVDRSDPRRPWRLLLLNRAILATRTCQRPLMERAFQSLLSHLPEDAAEFFREGMAQVEHASYPPQARELMLAYYQAWGLPRTLH